MLSRGPLAALAAASLLAGCASFQTAVIGPSADHGVAMWRGVDTRGVAERREGELVPMSWARALGVGLDPTWALVDFHEVEPASTFVVVEGLHRVDGTERFPELGPLVEEALGRHAIWVASHQPDTDEVLAQFPDATVPTPEPRIVAIGWSTDRLEITLTTTFAATIVEADCGGARQPEVEHTLGGMEWTRTYEVTSDRTVTPTSDDGGHLLPPGPRCPTDQP